MPFSRSGWGLGTRLGNPAKNAKIMRLENLAVYGIPMHARIHRGLERRLSMHPHCPYPEVIFVSCARMHHAHNCAGRTSISLMSLPADSCFLLATQNILRVHFCRWFSLYGIIYRGLQTVSEIPSASPY